MTLVRWYIPGGPNGSWSSSCILVACSATILISFRIRLQYFAVVQCDLMQFSVMSCTTWAIACSWYNLKQYSATWSRERNESWSTLVHLVPCSTANFNVLCCSTLQYNLVQYTATWCSVMHFSLQILDTALMSPSASPTSWTSQMWHWCSTPPPAFRTKNHHSAFLWNIA